MRPTQAMMEGLEEIKSRLEGNLNLLAEFNKRVQEDRLRKLDGRGGLMVDEDSLTARESYDRETRGTFDAEGRVRS